MRNLIPTLSIVCTLVVCFATSARAGSTSVVVVDESGAPVPGSRITLMMNRGEQDIPIGQGVAGPDGKATILYKEPGPSTLSTSFHLVASTRERIGFEPVLNPEATQHILCSQRVSISGTVQNSRGEPVAGLVIRPNAFIRNSFFGQDYISFERVAATAGIDPAVSDATGRFTISGIPSGWHVSLDAGSGWRIGTVGGQSKPGGSILGFENALPAGADDIVITLKEAEISASGRIRGKLLDEQTGDPIPGITVTAVRLEKDGSAKKMSAITRGNGSFEITGLDSGDYTVFVMEADKPVPPETDVGVRAGEITEITMYATEGTEVRGKAVDAATAKELSGIIVASPGGTTSVTGADGTFSVRMLPGPGVLSAIGQNVGYGRLDHELEIPETGSVADVVLKLSQAPTITGRVLSPDGKAVDGAIVRAVTAAGPSDPVQADSNGVYRLTLSEPLDGGYVIACAPDAGAGAIANIASTKEVWKTCNLSLKATAKVEGKVINAEGKAVVGARVIPVLIMGGVRLYSLHNTAITDADGRFTLDRLIPDADYSVRIEADGYAPLSPGTDRLPALKSGMVATAKFTLNLKSDRP